MNGRLTPLQRNASPAQTKSQSFSVTDVCSRAISLNSLFNEEFSNAVLLLPRGFVLSDTRLILFSCQSLFRVTCTEVRYTSPFVCVQFLSHGNTGLANLNR